MTKISIILPVYNADKYLHKAINSILSQTFTDWELIIINDGSTDNSYHIISSFSDPRIRYYENETNQGLIKTLNRAVYLSRGEYIARMDADDVCLSARLAVQSDFLDRQSDYAMCGSWVKVIAEDDRQIGRILNFTGDTYLKIHLLFSVPFVHPSVMIRTQILKNNLYDERFVHAEDYELWCRIADKYKIANISSNLLNYRWHSTNVSVLNSERQQAVKNTIIERELSKIGITPTQEELWLQQITFQQNNLTNNRKIESFNGYSDLNRWFQKIVNANKKHKRYDNNSLMAYLWSRWIVLCIAQKKRSKIFRASFISYSPDILLKTFRLLLFYSKK